MKRLSRCVLAVDDLTASVRFYRDQLGMRSMPVASGSPLGSRGHLLHCRATGTSGDDQIALELCPASQDRRSRAKAVPGRLDQYWKIGLTVPDVDRSRRRLRDLGVPVTEPTQFEDLGYMCHLHDPDGFSVELLQHTFASPGAGLERHRSRDLEPKTLAHVTVRTHDIDTSLEFWCGHLGMQLLSTQAIERYGFSLYFLAFTEEAVPDVSQSSTEHKEWLGQRPYTSLELQHHWRVPRPRPYRGHGAFRTGFRGLVVEVEDPSALVARMLSDGAHEAGPEVRRGEQHDRGALLAPEGFVVCLADPSASPA